MTWRRQHRDKIIGAGLLIFILFAIPATSTNDLTAERYLPLACLGGLVFLGAVMLAGE